MDARLESLEQWDAAPRSERVELARVLADRLQEQGKPLDFEELLEIEPFRPEASMPRLPKRHVALFRDKAAKVSFALIPGGQVPRWGEPQEKAILRAMQAIEGWRDDAATRGIAQVRPYGASGFDVQSMFEEAPKLAPFLVAVRAITAATPGLDHLDWKKTRMSHAQKGEAREIALLEGELPALLQARGWSLPTRHQAWWMTAPDPRWVFPWGDKLPKWMCDGEDGEEPSEEEDDRDPFGAAFPYDSADEGFERANAFGLVDLLAASYWVQLEGELGWHGGAAECYPWQACGEWAGFISRAVAPEPDPAKDRYAHNFGHRLRPVISIGEPA
ncbi:MAG: hypothetical protein QM723_02375 [Myxococcaceae bacterium]